MKQIPESYLSGTFTSGHGDGATVHLHFSDATAAEKWFNNLTGEAHPAREWVGLTDADKTVLWANHGMFDDQMDAIEAMLREKNAGQPAADDKAGGEVATYSGADENPPVFGRRWSLARDGFGLQRDDADGAYVDIDDALSVLHHWQSNARPQPQSEVAGAARVLEWMRDPKRKPAQLAFTAGAERQAAYWIEIAQAEEAHASGGWQPIETAPKDGTPVLVFVDGKMTCAAFDSELLKEWEICVPSQGHRESDCVLPTHWMPLPAVPKPEKDEL